MVQVSIPPRLRKRHEPELAVSEIAHISRPAAWMREVPPNQSGTPAIEVPDYLKGVNLHDLNELCTNSPALSGLWEKSETATAIHEHQVRLASQNEEHTKRLSESMLEIEALRVEVDKFAQEERTAQEQWQNAESQMLAATRRYSPTSIKRAIEKDVTHLEEDSRVIEGTFRDGLETEDDPIALAKLYVQKRRQYYYYNSLLDSLPG